MAKNVQQQAYIGPSFKEVKHCTVYLGELPPSLKNAMKECIAFKRLLVGLEQYSSSLDDLKNSTSTVAINYKSAYEYIKKGI